MIDSILTSIKKQLGLEEDYEVYDQDILLLINSAFLTLQQLNVGPKNGFRVTSKEVTWNDFSSDSLTIDAVKSYVYAKVKLIFDPPSSSYVAEAYNKMIAELEFRLLARNDEPIDYTPFSLTSAGGVYD